MDALSFVFALFFILLFQRDRRFAVFGYVRGGEPVVFEQRRDLAGSAEFILYADSQHRYGRSGSGPGIQDSQETEAYGADGCEDDNTDNGDVWKYPQHPDSEYSAEIKEILRFGLVCGNHSEDTIL